MNGCIDPKRDRKRRLRKGEDVFRFQAPNLGQQAVRLQPRLGASDSASFKSPLDSNIAAICKVVVSTAGAMGAELLSIRLAIDDAHHRHQDDDLRDSCLRK